MNHYLKIEEVLIPKEVHDKLKTISDHDKVPIPQIASQAIQEWIVEHFGKRYPANS